MKTFYTLLLAFGLCFTVHAQEMFYVKHDGQLLGINQEDEDFVNNYFYGDSTSIIVGDFIEYRDPHTLGVFKHIYVKDVNYFGLLDSTSLDLEKIEMLSVDSKNRDINLDQEILIRLADLKILYIMNVKNIQDLNILVSSLNSLFPSLKVIVRISNF